MELQWIIVALVLVSAFALILFLIIRNKKDKDDVVQFLNENEIDDEL